MAGVDALDEQILSELQAQGRLTMKALAEQVGLSSPAMIERVRRLEDQGVIAGYRAVIQPAALGRPLTALITARVREVDRLGFLEKIQLESAIAECHRVTGNTSYVIKAHLADLASLEALVDQLGTVGALCETQVVLSSPVEYRPVTPSQGKGGGRTRLSRRRRRDAGLETIDGESPAAGKRKTARVREGRRAAPPVRETTRAES